MNIFRQIHVDLVAIKKNRKDIRNFGLLVGAISIGLGILYHGYSIFIPLIIIGGLLIVLGSFVTKTLLYPYLAWMTLATIIGFFVFRILLAILYFCVIIPIGLTMRLLRFKEADKSPETYWIKFQKKHH